MTYSNESRLKKLEAAMAPSPESAGVAWCFDRHSGANVEPIPCQVGDEWFARDELPENVDLVFHLIREPGAEPSAGLR